MTIDALGTAPVIIKIDEDCSFLADVIRIQHSAGLNARLPVLSDLWDGSIKCSWSKYGLALRNASRDSLKNGPPSLFGSNLNPHIELEVPRYSILHNMAGLLVYRPSEVEFCYFNKVFGHWYFSHCRVVAII